jgi:hypothetical protein
LYNLTALFANSDKISEMTRKYQSDPSHPLTTGINKLKATVKDATQVSTLDSEEAGYFRSLLGDLIPSYDAPAGFRRCCELIKNHKKTATNYGSVKPAGAKNSPAVSYAVPILYV